MSSIFAKDFSLLYNILVENISAMNKNFATYQKLKFSDERKFKAGEYVVIVGGKLFRKGKDLAKILTDAKKNYPQETPLVTKVPHKGVFIFFYD